MSRHAATGALLGLCASTWPSMLPRPLLVQVVESAVLLLIGWAVGGALGRARVRVAPGPAVLDRVAPGPAVLDRVAPGPAVLGRVALPGPLAAPVALGVRVCLAAPWLVATLAEQDHRRVAVGPAAAGPGRGVAVVALSVALATVLVLAARFLARRARRGLLVVPVLCAVVATTTLVGSGPAAASVPVSSAASVRTDATGAVHVTVPLDADPSPRRRADRAVAALADAGGLRRGTLLVAVPTGSGWVDRAGVDALAGVVGGDLATVTVPYDDVPSWVAYATAQDRAVAATRDVLDAVASRAPRARVVLYGESLGALAVARAWAGSTLPVDGALLVGPPAGTPGAPGRAVTVAHADDPVPVWSARLLVARPPGWPTDRPWAPVLSWLQTGVDLLVALGVPAGHGHHYGDEQRAAWATLLDRAEGAAR